MKIFRETLEITFAVLGAVIGAGFVSGREIIDFFGRGGALAFIVAATGFVFGLFSVFSFGRISAERKGEKLFVFRRPKLFSFIQNFSSFIILCASLAGLNYISETIGFFKGFPVFSIILLVAEFFLYPHGYKAVKKLNFILVPTIIITLNFLMFFKTKTDFLSQADYSVSAEKNPLVFGFVTPLLYVFINLFANFRGLSDCAANKSAKSIFFAATLSGLLTVFEIYFIARTVKLYGDANSYAPFFSAIDCKSAFIYVGLSLLSSLTTVITLYFPLAQTAKNRGGNLGVVIMTTGAFAVSLVGLKKIISVLYPIIGVLGGAYILKTTLFAVKSIKRNKNADNNFINTFRESV